MVSAHSAAAVLANQDFVVAEGQEEDDIDSVAELPQRSVPGDYSVWQSQIFPLQHI